MTNFKEQLVADMANVFMNTNEFAVSARLVHRNGATEICSCSIEIIGNEEGEWSGGWVTVANILMSKSELINKPEIHSVIKAENEIWTIDSILAEDNSSWQLKAFKGYKPK